MSSNSIMGIQCLNGDEDFLFTAEFDYSVFEITSVILNGCGSKETFTPGFDDPMDFIFIQEQNGITFDEDSKLFLKLMWEPNVELTSDDIQVLHVIKDQLAEQKTYPVFEQFVSKVKLSVKEHGKVVLRHIGR